MIPNKKSFLFVPLFSLVFLVLLALPYFVDLFYQTFLTEVLVWVLFAISFDLIFGYTGLLSFGQALFFGLGAYAFAIPIVKFGLGPGTAFLLSILIPMVFSWFVGYFSVRLSGIHFVIITLIFALMGSTIGETWSDLTGGADGMTIPLSPIPIGPWHLDLIGYQDQLLSGPGRCRPGLSFPATGWSNPLWEKSLFPSGKMKTGPA